MGNDVKWIKIVTDLFDDEKILLIESLPEADSIIVIWFKLLCLAGKQNNSGVFLMNNRIPYTDEMLATIFRRKVNTVKLALKTFEEFGMIEIVNNVVTIPNWSKHQNLDQLEERKEYMKDYMRKYREKQKLIAHNESDSESDFDCKVNSKVNSKVNVNTLEEEGEKEIERDIEKEEKKDVPDTNVGNTRVLSKNTRAPSKHIHGEHKKVRLTDDELNKLKSEYSNSDELIQYLDEYKAMTGKTYKSDYLAIKKWVVNAVEEKRRKQQSYRKNQRVVPLPKYMTEQAEEKREASAEEKAETLKEMYKVQMMFEQYDLAEQSAKEYYELTGHDIKDVVGEVKPFEE